MQILVSRMVTLQKKSKICKFKMTVGRHFENSFWPYLSKLLCD